MPFIKGQSAVKTKMRRIPDHLRRVLTGAARKGGGVFANYVKENTPSDAVREKVRVRTKLEGDYVRTTVDVAPGWARSLGHWLERGTSPHFITVDDGQRRGRGIGRINEQLRENDGNSSLVIGGQFVGTTVLHPGARPHPTFRPARDLMEGEAVAAAQTYINMHAGKLGAPDADEGDAG